MAHTPTTNTVPVPDARAFFKGLPWIFLLFILAFVSWKFWTPFLALFMPLASAQFASIGVSTMGAYVVVLIALAGNWPLAGIGNPWLRGIAMIVVAKVLAALGFIVLAAGFQVDLTAWAFPIIANSWLILAATSFVGGDAHLQHIPPLRRMLLNLIISVGFTLVLMRTIVIFPAYWFGFLQAIIITGGLSYFFRNIKQPTFSILSWALLMALMFALLVAASWCGSFDLNGKPSEYWLWNLGEGSPAFNLFFALTCGLNFSIFACTQCWPFCRIRQPWGTPVALFSMLGWCLALTWLLTAIFRKLVPGEEALWEVQIMAWHTVFWGFSWVYCFGVGQTPYRWTGQKTPGTWDDMPEESVSG